MAANSLVTGTIEFTELPNLPPEAKVYVRLLDTSTADAPAVLIAEQVLQGLTLEANQSKKISFELRNLPIIPSGQYTVSVLVDIDGDGRVGRGDFISKQSYPVLTRGYPTHTEIRVERVR